MAPHRSHRTVPSSNDSLLHLAVKDDSDESASGNDCVEYSSEDEEEQSEIEANSSSDESEISVASYRGVKKNGNNYLLSDVDDDDEFISDEESSDYEGDASDEDDEDDLEELIDKSADRYEIRPARLNKNVVYSSDEDESEEKSKKRERNPKANTKAKKSTANYKPVQAEFVHVDVCSDGETTEDDDYDTIEVKVDMSDEDDGVDDDVQPDLDDSVEVSLERSHSAPIELDYMHFSPEKKSKFKSCKKERRQCTNDEGLELNDASMASSTNEIEDESPLKNDPTDDETSRQVVHPTHNGEVMEHSPKCGEPMSPPSSSSSPVSESEGRGLETSPDSVHESLHISPVEPPSSYQVESLQRDRSPAVETAKCLDAIPSPPSKSSHGGSETMEMTVPDNSTNNLRLEQRYNEIETKTVCEIASRGAKEDSPVAELDGDLVPVPMNGKTSGEPRLESDSLVVHPVVSNEAEAALPSVENDEDLNTSVFDQCQQSDEENDELFSTINARSIVPTGKLLSTILERSSESNSSTEASRSEHSVSPIVFPEQRIALKSLLTPPSGVQGISRTLASLSLEGDEGLNSQSAGGRAPYRTKGSKLELLESSSMQGGKLAEEMTSEEITKSTKKPTIRREGRIQHGQWKVAKKIGRGAFGVVHLGIDTHTGALFAVKSVLMDPIPMSDAKREIQLLRTLKHPNIVQYYGAEMNQTHLHIFQEWIPGGSITSMLAMLGPFSLSVIRSYLAHILQGLSYLHENNIIHRDIKGSNILVTDKGVVKLADFGAGKQLASSKANAMMTMTCRGTPYFMAPEVFEEKYSKKADIWSVGCVVIQMATGSPPWKDLGLSNPVALFRHISDSGPPNWQYDQGEMNGDISNGDQKVDELQEFVGKCFQKIPSDRPEATRLLSEPFVFTDFSVQLDTIDCCRLFSPTPHKLLSKRIDHTLSPVRPLFKRSSSCDPSSSPMLSPPLPSRPLSKSVIFSPKADTSDWPSWAKTNSRSAKKLKNGLDGTDSLAYSESHCSASSSFKENVPERSLSETQSGSSLVGMSFIDTGSLT